MLLAWLLAPTLAVEAGGGPGFDDLILGSEEKAPVQVAQQDDCSELLDRIRFELQQWAPWTTGPSTVSSGPRAISPIPSGRQGRHRS